MYRSGKAAVSGFGEAALDRALADQNWIEQQLHRLRTNGPRRAKSWAADAIVRLGPEVSWTTCAEEDDAKYLERRVLAVLRPYEMWNIR